uniref:Uncharacterized protein n=1 Tax=Pongo abelii TaxID=9601 RepID=A0A8I5URK1_PONAB
MKISTTTMKIAWRFLKNLKVEMPYAPAFLLLNIREKRSVYKRNTCTPLFTAALFNIAKIWNQPKCLSTDKWIRKM